MYGVLANCAILFNALFVGVGQAVQPVSAFNFGAGQNGRIAKLRKYAYSTVLIMGVVFALSGILFPEFVASCFIDLTDATREVTKTAMPIYFIAFFAMGVNVLSTYYFQFGFAYYIAYVFRRFCNMVCNSDYRGSCCGYKFYITN